MYITCKGIYQEYYFYVNYNNALKNAFISELLYFMKQSQQSQCYIGMNGMVLLKFKITDGSVIKMFTNFVNAIHIKF